jgi:hypothetical protein
VREAVRIREADAVGAGAVPLPAGGINKAAQREFKHKQNVGANKTASRKVVARVAPPKSLAAVILGVKSASPVFIILPMLKFLGFLCDDFIFSFHFPTIAERCAQLSCSSPTPPRLRRGGVGEIAGTSKCEWAQNFTRDRSASASRMRREQGLCHCPPEA